MWLNPQGTPDFVTFTEETLMENFIFLCSVFYPVIEMMLDYGTLFWLFPADWLIFIIDIIITDSTTFKAEFTINI